MSPPGSTAVRAQRKAPNPSGQRPAISPAPRTLCCRLGHGHQSIALTHLAAIPKPAAGSVTPRATLAYKFQGGRRHFHALQNGIPQRPDWYDYNTPVNITWVASVS